MRLRPSVVFLFFFILTVTVLSGCNPESHPRRDRKARGLALQNLGRADDLADAQDQLRDDLDAKCDEIAALQDQIDALTLIVAQLVEKEAESSAKCDALVALLAGLSRNDNTLILTGVNLRLQDADSGPRAPGLGNLFIGRDDEDLYKDFYGRDPLRDGSNNLIIGGANDYSGSGGLCVGVLNLLNSDSSVVLSCENEVRAEFGSVLGGTGNLSQGRFSTVGGGLNRVASGRFDFRAGHLFSDQ